MIRIAAILPYAVSIRDFVYSGALKEIVLDTNYQITIYTLNADLEELNMVHDLGVSIKEMQPYADSKIELYIKRIYPYFFADKFTKVSQSVSLSVFRQIIAAFCISFRRLVGVQSLLRIVAGALKILNQQRGVSPQLDPDTDLLIATRSLINSIDYGLIAEAVRFNIPIVTLASSWDNFTTKGFFPFPVLKTVVWNEKMKAELIELFDVQPNSIEIAGYPRAITLSNYAWSIDSNDYLKELNITGYSRYVLFSASFGDLSRIPNQPYPLEYMAMRQIIELLLQDLPDDTCILIRMHPFSKIKDSAIFDGLRSCFVISPGREDRYVERVMNYADERHLAIQLSQAVCIVSMASTISLDAIYLHKPIINIGFDPIPGLPKAQSLVRFYEYNHFRDFLRLTRVPKAKNEKEVIAFVLSCLKGSYVNQVDFESFNNFYIPINSINYGKKIAKIIASLSIEKE